MPVGKFAHSLCSLSRCEDNIHPAEQAYLLLLPPLRSPRCSCVQYLYISRGFFFSFFFPPVAAVVALEYSCLASQHCSKIREQSTTPLNREDLPPQAPPLHAFTSCFHLIRSPRLLLISPPPSLLFYISETSLHGPHSNPPAPSISFLLCSSHVLVLNTPPEPGHGSLGVPGILI